MSDQDRALLAKLGPELISQVTIAGSDLLARLRANGALTEAQNEIIQVIKQYHTFQLFDSFFV